MSDGPTGWAKPKPTGPRSDDPIAEHFRQQELNRKGFLQQTGADVAQQKQAPPKPAEPEPDEVLSPSEIPKKANKADTDVFDILGIPKSDDYLKAEQRKHDMLTKSAQKFTDVLIQRRKPVIQAKGKFGDKWNKAFMRRASAPEVQAPAAPAQPWEQFTMNQDDSNYFVDEVARFSRPKVDPKKKGSSAGLSAQCFVLRWNTEEQVSTAYFDGTIQIFDVGRRKLQYEVNMIRLRQYEMVRAGSMDPEKLQQAVNSDPLSVTVAPAVTNLRWRPTADRTKASQVLASVDTNGTLALWQVTAGADNMALIGHTTDDDNELYGVDFCAEDIVCAGKNRYVSVFDAHTLELKAQLKGRRDDGHSELMTHTNRVVSIKAHPLERELFVSGGLDRSVKVWDLRVGEPVLAIGGPMLAGDCLDFNTKGDWLLTASGRNSDQLEIWDWRQTQRVFFGDFGGQLDMYRQCSVTCAAFSRDPQSQFILAGGQANAYARIYATPRHGEYWHAHEVELPMSPKASLSPKERSKTSPARGVLQPATSLLEGEKGLFHAVSTWTGSEVSYRCVEGSPEGKKCAFGCTDGTVIVSTTEKKKSKVMCRRASVGFNA